MACEHKRIMSRNCVLMCADCGMVLPAQCAAGSPDEERVGSASGRKIGFNAETKPRKTRRKGTNA